MMANEKSFTQANKYRLATDGDDLEKKYWKIFIENYFPSYELFWADDVVPLTHRPYGIHFKNNEELKNIDKNENDLKIAQLGYSSIINLGRCLDVLDIFENSKKNIFEQRNLLIEGFARSIGAQDNIFELLERKNRPNSYDAFCPSAAMKARKKYIKENLTQGQLKIPLIQLRDYRNNLIHGGIHAAITGNDVIWFAKIGTEEKYLDWRIITSRYYGNEKKFEEEAKPDFITPFMLLEQALSITTKYFEDKFKEIYKK